MSRPVAERIRRHWRWIKYFSPARSPDPVLVLQMGKVGSISVYRAILNGTSVPVSHAHNFGPNHPNWELRMLHRRYVSREPLRVITPVREPASRLLSAAFQNWRELEVVYPDVPIGQGVVQAINDGWRDQSGDWFANNIKKPFGIDVYDEPFPESGFRVYESGVVSLLIYKVELGIPRISEIVRWYLRTPGLKIKVENESVAKGYGKVYSDLSKLEKLDPIVLRRLRSDHYARHFYPEIVHDNYMHE